MGLEAGQVMMVGDDAEADVLGAIDAGLQGALVRTGKYRPGDERRETSGGSSQTWESKDVRDGSLWYRETPSLTTQ